MEGDLQTDTLENNAKRATVLPSRYNAAEHDLVTPVKDQNPYGTCWAFSALSACETSMIRKGLQNTSFDLSEFHFAYFFFHTQEDALGVTAGDCTLLADPDYMDVGGADACTMFALSKWTGAAAESLASYPYEQLYTPSSSLAYQDVGHLQNVRYVNGSDTASIKRLILQYGSVSAPLCVNLKKFYSKSTGAYYCNNNTGTNHQLTIVGWDDDYSTANFTSGIRPSKKGAWIAKNSYGEEFGYDGYIYISYQNNSLHHKKKSTADSDSLVFAYDMENSDNYSHNYQYDGSASCTYMPIPSGSSLSNIFTVSGNPNGQEKLKSVSFALASENIQYAIQIYKNPTAGDPTSGIAVLDRAQSGVTTYCGYYTIPLNTEIVFNQGDRFSVVISFASPTNQTLYAFIDKSSSLESLHFVSSAEIGQSYYRTKANGWMDISYQQINNRIKAFTEITTEAATEILANVSALPKSSIRKIKSSRCSSLRLSWNAVQYADGYQIFLAPANVSNDVQLTLKEMIGQFNGMAGEGALSEDDVKSKIAEEEDPQVVNAIDFDSVKFCLKMLFLNIESKKNGETEEKTVEYALSLQINAEGLIPKEIKIFQIDSLSFNIWNTQRQTVLEKMALITPDSF